jgi:hypothetical protein
MGDKAKGRDTGKAPKKKAAKAGKHGLRPHEQREREGLLTKKPG